MNEDKNCDRQRKKSSYNPLKCFYCTETDDTISFICSKNKKNPAEAAK